MFQFKTIRTKFILFISLLIFLIIGVFVIVIDLHRQSLSNVGKTNATLMKTSIQEEWEKKIRTLTILMAKEFVQYMQELNVTEMDDLASIVMKEEGIIYVYVQDEKGRVLVDTTDKPTMLGEVLTDEFTKMALAAEHVIIQRRISMIDIAAPILVGITRMGFVRIGFSTEGIQKTTVVMARKISNSIDQAIDVTKRNILLLLSVVLVLAIAVGWFFMTKLFLPIKSLMLGIEKIAKGNLSYRIEMKSNDEIGQLAVSFNKMTKDLQKTTVSKDYVDSIIKNMNDSLVVLRPDITIKTVNKATLGLLGYQEDELIGKPVEMIFSGDKQHINSMLTEDVNLAKKAIIRNRETFYITKDSNKIPVLLSASVMFDSEGSNQGIICVAIDITERKKAERRMQESLREKEVLLQEIHHRVKNNLQVIISLLSLQSQYVKDQNIIQMFQQCQDRINSMAIIHEKIYRSKDLTNITLKDYIVDLSNDLFMSYKISDGQIKLKLDIENISLGIDTCIPCGLIINELLSNSLKYAFPDEREGEIEIAIHKISNGEIDLLFSDNGMGLPKMFDFRNSPGFGFRMIVDLVEYKLMGKIKQIQDEGTKFQIRFREIVYGKRI